MATDLIIAKIWIVSVSIFNPLSPELYFWTFYLFESFFFKKFRTTKKFTHPTILAKQSFFSAPKIYHLYTHLICLNIQFFMLSSPQAVLCEMFTKMFLQKVDSFLAWLSDRWCNPWSNPWCMRSNCWIWPHWTSKHHGLHHWTSKYTIGCTLGYNIGYTIQPPFTPPFNLHLHHHSTSIYTMGYTMGYTIQPPFLRY